MRAFDQGIKDLLRSPSLRMRLLMTFYLDPPELVVNGDFNSDLSSWVVGNYLSPDDNFTLVNGRARVTRGATSANSMYAYQIVPTEVGKTYHLSADISGQTATSGFMQIGTAPTLQDLGFLQSSAGFPTKTLDFVATTTATYITLVTFSSANDWAEFDNISMKEVITLPELVTNGGFTSSLASWIAGNGATLLNQGATQLRIVNSAAGFGFASQAIPTVPGTTYRVVVDNIVGGNSPGRLNIGSTAGGTNIAQFDLGNGTNTFTFTAVGSTTYIAPQVNSAVNGALSDFDNVSVKVNVDIPNTNVYRFCDDVVDVTDGTHLWIGAGALGAAVDIKSGRDLSAEPITVTLDGNHMAQVGVADPARVLHDIMGYLFTQRRVDIAWGFSYPDTAAIQLIIPVAAMKINTCRLLEEKTDWQNPNQEVTAKLEITLDSLAMRYSRATFRTRSDPDQREIDPTDAFFSFTADALNTERSLYWGKRAPMGGGFWPGFLWVLSGGEVGTRPTRRLGS